MIAQAILRKMIEHARNTEQFALYLIEENNPAADAMWKLANKLWHEANDYSLRCNTDIAASIL